MKHNITYCFKEDGYALPFVLLISFLVTTLLLGILSYLFFVNKNNITRLNKKRLDLACYSAVEKVVSEWESINKDTLVTIDSIPVKIKRQLKGLFWEIDAEAANKNDSAKTIYAGGISFIAAS